MNHEQNGEDLKALLQEAIVPVKDTKLQHDLWPAMLRKLDEQPATVPWFDWALAAILGTALIFLPGTIPALLYHL
jgi:hypothetical protein